jgi:DNA-binding transcriptional LysR family regulator
MDRFQGIQAFVAVVEAGSFARAAERLDRSVSAVSRDVAELEHHLDARLLNRTTAGCRSPRPAARSTSGPCNSSPTSRRPSSPPARAA